MSDENTVQISARLDPALLQAHPELAVLALELPDSDGEPVENERERFHMNLLLNVLSQHWHDRQDFYAAGNMFLYYCDQQARDIKYPGSEATPETAVWTRAPPHAPGEPRHQQTPCRDRTDYRTTDCPGRSDGHSPADEGP